MLQLVHRRHRLAAHIFDGVLVAEPVRPLHGVVHVPAPVVLAHVAERGADAALRGDGVAAGREHLGDAGGLQPGRAHAERGAQAGAAGADHHHVIGVVDDVVGADEGMVIAFIELPFVKAESQHRDDAGQRQQHAERLDHQQRADPDATRRGRSPRSPPAGRAAGDGRWRRPARSADAIGSGAAIQETTSARVAPVRRPAQMNHSVSGTSARAVRRCAHQCAAPALAEPRPRARPSGERMMSMCGLMSGHVVAHHTTRPTTQSSTVSTPVADHHRPADAVYQRQLEAIARHPRRRWRMPVKKWKNSASVQPNSSSMPIGEREPLHGGEGVVGRGGGDQPPGQQQRADAQRDAGDAMRIDSAMLIGRRRPEDAATAGGGSACRRNCAPPSARRVRLSMDRSILSARRLAQAVTIAYAFGEGGSTRAPGIRH